MTPGLQLYLDCIVFAFGAVVGSFLNVCVYRVPLGQSVVHPPSHCPHCNQPIRWFDNIPLVSYLALGRRCRRCGAGISPRYFLVELLTAVLFEAVWWKFGGGLIPIYWLVLAGFIVSTFIDIEHYIIPDGLTLGGIAAGLLLSALYPPLMGVTGHFRALGSSLAGALVGGLTLFAVVELGKLVFGRRKLRFDHPVRLEIGGGKLVFEGEECPWTEVFTRESDRIRFRASTLKWKDQSFENVDVAVSETAILVNGTEYGLEQSGPIEAVTEMLVIPREAMGFGDVKFIAAIGAFLGWTATLFVVAVSSVVGSLFGLALMAAGRKDLQSRIPYGPYIAAAATIWMFWGRDLVHWYLNLIGWSPG